MKFVHLSDLHLGKRVNEFSMLEDQEFILKEIVNIIKNSIESIDDGGIINIRVSVIDKYVYIYVEDNGCGMTKDELSNIKEMFYSTKRNGTGLGVALSNEIIVAHNGELNYSSVKNEGTICTVSLPM